MLFFSLGFNVVMLVTIGVTESSNNIKLFAITSYYQLAIT